VRRLGLLVDDELDIPTWQRRRQEPPVPAAERSSGGRRPAPAVEPAEDDDLDIPTFLRRGTD
jgi:hypothetical protein